MVPPERAASTDPPAEELLGSLNPEQREAVTWGGGPLLVLAGAGSGKTRVITHRIAWLVLTGRVDPRRVVAVTFTNKAAREMGDRVTRLLGATGPECWIGTFHALCLRLLRVEGPRIGLERGFQIYDSDDQLAVVKRLLREETLDAATVSPRSLLSRISRAKNSLRTADDLERRSFSPESRLLARVYRAYDAALRQANAVDFDDLLVRTLELFEAHPDVAARYAERCEHLLVDEYQDTNRPQYRLIRHLASAHGNVCVVGDEDQSIYRFRGAEIRNILDFEADHPGARTIHLERNYRSSGTIVEAATAVIAHNRLRKGKRLWTDGPPGERIELYRAADDREEALWIARRVRGLERERSFEAMAVLYRTNAQSRQLEEVFRREEIPYQLVGAVQFYERKEIKDLLAYLKLALNPSDDVAFRRAVNTPPRGIGDATLATVDALARSTGLPLMEAAGHALDQGQLGARAAATLRRFLDLVARFVRRADDEPAARLLEELIEAIDYPAYLEKAYDAQAAERLENVRAFVSAAAEHDEESAGPGLQGFLDRSALVAQADQVGGRPGVTLMTIHCAKGLEFEVVFLAGLEENVFPHAMSSDSEEGLEEERRLCYVALTRARRRLLLTLAEARRMQGAMIPNPPSRFLEELPPQLVLDASPARHRPRWDLRSPDRAYGATGSSAARAAARRPAPAPVVPPRGPRVDPADGYAVGASVRHPRFGDGTILDREGGGASLKLTIHFRLHGSKKILPAYTKLDVGR